MKTYSFFSFIADPDPRGTEDLDQTVITVPDMSLSVRDIIERFRRGTIDLSSLYRDSQDLTDDIDDDSLDDIDDITDIMFRSKSLNARSNEIIQSIRASSQNSIDTDGMDRGTAGDEI